MNRQIWAVALLTVLVNFGTLSPAKAADASAGLDLATAYIFRGVTVNDRWVAQPSMEISGIPHLDGLSIGAWGNFDLETGSGGAPESNEFSEVDLYSSYELPLGLECFSTSVGYTEYLYPNSELNADRELNAIMSFDMLLSPSLGVYVGVGGGLDEQVYLEGSLGHDHELMEDLTLSGSGKVAVLFQPKDSDADDGFSYVQFSAGLGYMIFSASVNVIVETDDKVTNVDEEVYGLFGISGDF